MERNMYFAPYEVVVFKMYISTNIELKFFIKNILNFI